MGRYRRRKSQDKLKAFAGRHNVNKFPQRAGLVGKDQGDADALYDVVYLEDTDKPLPETINYRTRYAYFKTIARGGKSLIMSCKDLHLSRVVCYKTLRPELANDPIEQQRLLREAREIGRAHV